MGWRCYMHGHGREKGKLGPVIMMLGGAIAIVGLTAYAIITLTAPPQPVHDEVSPPENNTPYVGKKW
jgi:hypothetical protein